MKTKFLKIGMPIMVFMLAIVFAFASETTTAKDDSLIVGYIFENNQCTPAIRDCNNNGGPLCKQGLLQVYLEPGDSNSTFCVTELTHMP